MNKLDRLAHAPMTGSSAEYLARTFSHSELSLVEFADTLPRNSRIIDVAAGLSDFGAEVARRRKDIRWVNFDIQYNDINLKAALEINTPGNVRHMYGDIRKIPKDWYGEFDRVYSYNFLPHLLRIDRELGRKALRGMVDLLKPGGELAVGPTHKNPEPRELAISDHALWLEQGVISEAMITPALNALTIPDRHQRRYDAMDSSRVSVFPAERFDPESRGNVISDDGGITPHRIYTPAGLRLAGRLAAAYIRPEKFDDPD